MITTARGGEQVVLLIKAAAYGPTPASTHSPISFLVLWWGEWVGATPTFFKISCNA